MVVVWEVEVDLQCMAVPLVLRMLFGVAPYHMLVTLVGIAELECTVEAMLVAMVRRHGLLVRASSA